MKKLTTMTKANSRGDRKSSSGPVHHWIRADEYLRLLVSPRLLVRCDQPRHGLRGLVDPTTGECYWIPEEQSREVAPAT